MIFTGALRIITVKSFFQVEKARFGAADPLLVTLLYLAGQSLSLVVYFVCVKHSATRYRKRSDIEFDWQSSEPFADRATNIDEDGKIPVENKSCLDRNDAIAQTDAPARCKKARRGSKTGITIESDKAVAWVHRIPWFLKPAIPGIFNLCNSALRWGCLVFVAASTAEMLISGLELVLSVLAARFIRKRMISNIRWIGTLIVAVGLILVGFANVNVEEEKDRDGGKNMRNLLIGNILIVGQCIFSVLQDLAEEIILQETEFPATLLMGMEGMFGLILGLAICIGFSPEALPVWEKSEILFATGFVFLVLVTGILNISATALTSSMTRNVWKQFRTMLVWLIGLGIYYVFSQKNADGFGEQWVLPGSIYVLGSFSVIIFGVYVYYANWAEIDVLLSVRQRAVLVPNHPSDEIEMKERITALSLDRDIQDSFVYGDSFQ